MKLGSVLFSIMLLTNSLWEATETIVLHNKKKSGKWITEQEARELIIVMVNEVLANGL